MPKKITINKGDEEIELTEREEKIYQSGHSDGSAEGMGIMAISIFLAAMIVLIALQFRH